MNELNENYCSINLRGLLDVWVIVWFGLPFSAEFAVIFIEA